MNIKKTAFFLLLAFSTHQSIYAGSSNAEIECKSGSGRTTLTFFDQDIQGYFQGGTFTVDKKSINYLPQYDEKTNKDHPYSWMTVNMKEGVYTLVYKDEKKLFKLLCSTKQYEKKGKRWIGKLLSI